MSSADHSVMNLVLFNSNVPFDKEELDAILKFGTDELFKEEDKDDKALKVLYASWYSLCWPCLGSVYCTKKC